MNAVPGKFIFGFQTRGGSDSLCRKFIGEKTAVLAAKPSRSTWVCTCPPLARIRSRSCYWNIGPKGNHIRANRGCDPHWRDERQPDCCLWNRIKRETLRNTRKANNATTIAHIAAVEIVLVDAKADGCSATSTVQKMKKTKRVQANSDSKDISLIGLSLFISRSAWSIALIFIR